LGTTIRYLQDAHEGQPANLQDCIADNIDYLFLHLQDIGLRVTSATDAADDLVKLGEQLREQDEDYRITKAQAGEIKRAATRLRETLMAEADSRSMYLVTDKRIDTQRLLNDVSGLFAPGVFENLPDLAQYDLREAGRSIAFELNTAAAFHALRATEAVLRFLYCRLVKRNRCDPPLWHPIVSELRSRKRKPLVPGALLDDLDSIRRNYRNPTQHPEMTYTSDTAQDLFNACSGAINRIIAFLLESGLVEQEDA